MSGGGNQFQKKTSWEQNKLFLKGKFGMDHEFLGSKIEVISDLISQAVAVNQTAEKTEI